MDGITAQAGTTGQVLNLARESWRTPPRRAAAETAQQYRVDRWIRRNGGLGSAWFAAIDAEAMAVAGGRRHFEYLNMCAELDKAVELAAGRRRAAAELAARAAAEREREITLARVMAKRAEAAAKVALRQAGEIALAVEDLAADPRLADRPDSGADEAAYRRRVAEGLAGRPMTGAEASLPLVGELAKRLGVKW